MQIFDLIKQKIFLFLKEQHPKHQASFPHFENVRSALVLFESDNMEKNPAIETIRQDLMQQNIDVVTWGYRDGKHKEGSAILPQRRILTQEDFTFYGTPKDVIIADLEKREYDLLIDLTQHDCLALHYISLYSKAYFKCGKVLTYNDGILDFMLDMPAEDSPMKLYQQILHFLMTIQSKD